MPAPLTGQRIARSEDHDFLTGAAKYVADLSEPELAGAAAVTFVRSTLGHARFTVVDVEAARSADGVLAVVTADDHEIVPIGPFAENMHAMFTQPLLAEKRVRYVGEPIVAIVAETIEAAVDAAELVVIDYEPLPAVVDAYDALSDRVVIFDGADTARTRAAVAPWQPTNTVFSVPAVAVDDARFAAAEVSVTLRVRNPRQSPAPIETRAMACVWQGDELLVWSATQVPHGYAGKLADLYDLPLENIRVIAGPNVGGGFGGKTSRSPAERLMPHLARITGRPVQWMDTRSEYLAAATQSRAEHIDITLAGDADGRFTALRMHMVKDAGAYPGVGARLPGPYSAPMAGGAYDIDHIEFGFDIVVTNAPQVGAFRGAGRAPLIDALERAVDEFARVAGLDPADVRRQNLIRPEQMPYATPLGGVYDEANYPADLQTALDAAGYPGLRQQQAERRATGDRRQLGIGIGCYLHLTGGGGGEEASVTMQTDGTATLVTGSTSQGHGHVTTWAQIAADVLGLPIDSIRVVEGDTAAIGSGSGAVGSRSAQTAGIAIHNAAEKAVERGRNIAAQLLEAAEADVVFEVGRSQFEVRGTPARGVSWVDVATAAASNGDPITCGDFFDPETGVVPSGSHIAVVEVDTDTGATTVLRFIAVDDAGLRINPTIVEGQIHGGIAVGIAQALGEEMVYDANGTLLTSNFVDYAVIPIDWVPQYELIASETRTSRNQLGIKAVGESGPVGATAAVHNAVLDAIAHLGVAHIDIPCHPERVWRALQSV